MCATAEEELFRVFILASSMGRSKLEYNPALEERQVNTVISCQKSTESNRNTDLYILVNNFDVSELAVS
jgi:hypothetical protein